MTLQKKIITAISIGFYEYEKRASIFVHFDGKCEQFHVFDPYEALAYFAELRKCIGKEILDHLLETPSAYERESHEACKSLDS